MEEEYLEPDEVETGPTERRDIVELRVTGASPGGEIMSNVAQLIDEARAFVEDNRAITVADEDDLKYSKSLRARVNNIVKSIDTERRKLKAAYMAPFDAWDSQAKTATALLKEVADSCKANQDAYEETLRSRRRAFLEESYEALDPELAELVPLGAIEEKDWYLRKTKTDKHAEALLINRIKGIRADLASIESLDMTEAERDTARNTYLRTLDLAKAVQEVAYARERNETVRRQKREREAWEREVRGEPAPEPTYTLTLSGVTKTQAEQLVPVLKGLGLTGSFKKEA
jgi:hypothetical protein